jgi:hypothetical protein
MRWRSIRRRRHACGLISSSPGTAPTSRGRCSGRWSTTASAAKSAGAWTPTRSTAWSGNTPASSGSIADTRRTRCGRHSLPRPSENGAQLEDVQKAAGHRDPGNKRAASYPLRSCRHLRSPTKPAQRHSGQTVFPRRWRVATPRRITFDRIKADFCAWSKCRAEHSFPLMISAGAKIPH